MPKIEALLLRCADPQSQRQFYCDALGMKDYGDGSVGYGAEETRICFLKTDSHYKPQANDTYWKIALAVPNIDLAYQQLSAKNLHVSVPSQFQNVGFLAKFADPEGFIIELIDHQFQGNRPDSQHDHALLGGGAHFNLLTLRTADIEKVREFCTRCGMTTLCIQPVENHGFTLYFFAFTTDVPPSPDLYSVANREWLYQRPYTVLEVQHVHDAASMLLPDELSTGYAGSIFSGISPEILSLDLLIGVEGEHT